MQRVAKRRGLVEDPHQLARLDGIAHQPGRQARQPDSLNSRRRCDLQAVAGELKATRGQEIQRTALGIHEVPWMSTCLARIANKPMVQCCGDEVSSIGRPLAPGQIARRGIDAHPLMPQLSRGQRSAVIQASAADGKVNSLLDQIDAPVIEGDMEGQLRVASAKLEQQWRDQGAPNQLGGCHTESPDGSLPAGLDFGVGGIQLRQGTAATRVVRVAILGQALAASGAIEQARAQPRLQSRNALGDRRSRHLQSLRGKRKVTGLHCSNEGLDSVQTFVHWRHFGGTPSNESHHRCLRQISRIGCFVIDREIYDMSDILRRWQLDDWGLQHLKTVELPIPTPGPGQVLVNVQAVSLNYRDLFVTEHGYGGTLPLPFVPASDMAGTIAAVGAGVTQWHEGDRVISTFMSGWLDGKATPGVKSLGGPGPGVLSTHVVLDAHWVVSAPTTLDDVEASTLPCAALTAWFSLIEEGGLRAGQTVLIHGSGGVATFGIQFARMHGACVIVVSGGKDKRDRILGLGAHHVLDRDGDWPDEVRRITGGTGADHVLETVGGPNLGRSLTAMAQGGRLALIGVLDGHEVSGTAYDALLRRVTIKGITVGHRRSLEEMVRAIDLNGAKPVIAAQYTFDDAPAAFEHLRRGVFGKLVVRFPRT